MAKLQKKPQENHDNDWLNTYADMVTLLLTFFVLLYASSSLDEQKWQYIYQAFQSHGKYLNEYVDSPNDTTDEGDFITEEDPTHSAGSGELPQSFDRLYTYLSDYVTENNLADSVFVEKGAAHIYIRFENSVFFEGNSSVLKESGKAMIDDIAPALRAARKFIQRCTVSGHTAQGISEINDWDLSSARACSVVKYMEFTSVLDSQQFMVQGCGPTQPIGDNSTDEGRAMNRRVEMVILKNDFDTSDPEVIKDIWKHDYGLNTDDFDPGAGEDETTKLPNDAAQSVIDNIEHLFPNMGATDSDTFIGPFVPGDYESFIITEDAEAEAADTSSDAEG